MNTGASTSDDAAGFVGGIPENYDRGLGHILFTDYAEHTARLVSGYAPSRVLETGAGTGIDIEHRRVEVGRNQPLDSQAQALLVTAREA